MLTHKILACAFVYLLLHASAASAMNYLFSRVARSVLGVQNKEQKKPPIPALIPLPQTLSAQSNTVVRNKSTAANSGTSTTLIPHAVSHVPLPSEKSALAEDVRALTMAKTIENVLKSKEGLHGPVFVNINLNGQTVTESTAIANSTNHADSLEWLKKYKDRAESSCFEAFKWIQNNRKRFAFYCISGFYVSIQTYLWYLAYSLQQTTCWSLWKNQCSLEDLYRYKQTDLAREIMNGIRDRYQPLKKSCDKLALLTQFRKETDVELVMLSRYRSIVNIIEKLCLGRIFFYNSKLHQDLTDRINRLLFIKNSVLAVSEQKNEEKEIL